MPLIHINRSVVVLEPPSKATKDKIAGLEKAKTLPNEKELSFMKKKKKEMKELQKKAENPDATGEAAKEAASKKRKRKGPKQPNPLSVKKKKKQPPPPPKPKTSENTSSTPKPQGESTEN